VDARKLSPEVQADLRRRVVAAVESGMSQQDAARVFGISRRAVGVWVRVHRRDGPDALRPQRRGRTPGEQFALSPRQQAELLHDLSAQTPDEIGLDAPLWSRRVVGDLVAARYGLELSSTTVGHYLDRWGVVGRSPVRGPTVGVHVSWHRARPTVLGVVLIDELHVLVARSGNGGARFLCRQRPFTADARREFADRLGRSRVSRLGADEPRGVPSAG
jgi:transposase